MYFYNFNTKVSYLFDYMYHNGGVTNISESTFTFSYINARIGRWLDFTLIL